MSHPFPSRNSSSDSFVRVNGKIRAREVRVIGVDNKPLGVITLNDALNLARQHGVDLVEVAATAVPPVCRLVNLGKFRYEKAKKEKQTKKHQHASMVKEVQLSPRIDPHDLGIKVAHAVGFLCEDMKVKVALKFRGREMQHTEIGFQVIKRFLGRNRALRPSRFRAEAHRPRHQCDGQPTAAQQARKKTGVARKQPAARPGGQPAVRRNRKKSRCPFRPNRPPAAS